MAELSNPQGTESLSIDEALSFMDVESETINPPDEVEDHADTSEAELSASEVEEVEAPAEVEAEADDLESDEPDAEGEFTLELDTVIELDGEQVTLADLQKGNMRQSDYTRKTQEVKRAQDSLSEQLENLAAERAHFARLSEQIEAQAQTVEQEPNWDTLYEEDPFEYVRQKELWRDKKEQSTQLRADREMANKRNAEHQANTAQQHLQQEQQKLLSALPDWKDPDVASREQLEISTYLASEDVGYTELEIKSAADSRAIQLARKAMLYDKLMAKKPLIAKKLVNKPRVVKAGSPVPRSQAVKSARGKQLAQLTRTGSIEDALSLL